MWHGERDYARLSSNLGACYYPAGHILHYIPVVWLHYLREDAESLMRMGHLGLYIVVVTLVMAIGQRYFGSKD